MMVPMGERSRSRPRLLLLLPAALLVSLIGLGLWLALRADGPAPRDEEARHEADDRGPAGGARGSTPGPGAPARPAPASRQGADAGGARGPTSGGAEEPVRDPSPDDSHDGPVHPHPITEQHQRIFRENQLIGALDGAMDVRDGAGMRRLLQRYRQEYPDDPSALQSGYELIADCLEHPGPAARAAAQRYYDTERGSTLRRFVARHCLEP
jgi:hypothetical protein